MSTVERYLTSYVRLRRMITAARSCCLAVAWGSVWLTVCLLLNHFIWISYTFLNCLLIGGGVLMLSIIARPISFLFRQFDPAAVAIEIESREPTFDQRLVTIVSQKGESQLRDYLLAEIQPMLSPRNARGLVSPRPLIFPALIMIGANIIDAELLRYFLHISR